MVWTGFPYTTVFLCFLFVPFLLGFACKDAIEEEGRQRVDVTSQNELHVENRNGKVAIQGWSESHMELRFVKRAAARELLDSIDVEPVQEKKTIRVFVRMPDEKRVAEECSPSVDLELKIPSGMCAKVFVRNGSVRVRDMNRTRDPRDAGPGAAPDSAQKDFLVETKNGEIVITDVVGSVSARNTNGKIRLDGIRGCADARSINGSVEAEIRETSACGRLRFETSNGSLRIKVVPGRIAGVVARTVNGGIDVRLPSAFTGTKTGKSVELRLRDAGAELEAFTTNGSIRIHEL